MLVVHSKDSHRVLWWYVLPAIVLCLGLALTYFAYAFVKKQQVAAQQSTFGYMADDLTGRLDIAMGQHEDLLVGLRGLFVASSEITRLEFHQFIESVALSERFPAIYGIGWNQKVLDEDVYSFEQWVRNDRSLRPEGYPEFSIKPATDNPVRFPLTFLAPAHRVQGAHGVDLGATASRRLAITAAIDTGLFAASPPVKLIDLDEGTNDAAGFVVALAVYETINTPDVDSRREQLLGVISGAFRVKRLLDSAGADQFAGVRVFDVTDVSDTSGSEPFYSMGKIEENFDYLIRHFEVAGRQWQVYLYQTPETVKQWVDTSTVPIVASLGFLVSVVSAALVHVLITSRNRAMSLARRLNSDLSRVNDDLSRSNHDLGQFAYVASHDLQTPIRNVQSTITLLEFALEDVDDPAVTRYLHYLQQSALRMQNLVGDLLFYARAERMDPELVEMDLNEVFDRTLHRLETTISESQATIDVQDLPAIMGDADQLERVISNLVVNAVKYRHADRSPRVRIHAELSGSEWAIHISDNGLGIEHKHLQRVFEPFHRLHRQDEIEGTGLGLSICKQIISSHGGRVHLESTLGEGSVFTLYFPAMQSARKAA